VKERGPAGQADAICLEVAPPMFPALQQSTGSASCGDVPQVFGQGPGMGHFLCVRGPRRAEGMLSGGGRRRGTRVFGGDATFFRP